ncbi:hypothetical protein QVD17_19629 [Tagetes erecta]|uniref:Transmembrane protein n=1 Tax=Tagetes erecta TaxID=13708 RepID=A0AAD8KQ31_TARER|nr:hypothetical protein QVD17_19629 [Tagetes erecta]
MVVFVEVDVDGGEVALTGGWRYLPDKDDDNGEILRWKKMMAVVRWMKIMAVLDLWWVILVISYTFNWKLNDS